MPQDTKLYSTKTNGELLRWFDLVNEAAEGRWYIIHLSSIVRKGKISLLNTVFDKIRSDFGGKQPSERCFQLREGALYDDTQGKELWSLFITRLHADLMASFDARYVVDDLMSSLRKEEERWQEMRRVRHAPSLSLICPYSHLSVL